MKTPSEPFDRMHAAVHIPSGVGVVPVRVEGAVMSQIHAGVGVGVVRVGAMDFQILGRTAVSKS